MSSLQYVFLLLGLVAVSLRHVRAFTADEIAAMKAGLRPIFAECGKEFGVTEEEVKKAKESGDDSSIDPCFFACFGKKIGVIDDKGEFSVEKSKELIKKFVTNNDEQTKALEIVEKCGSVNDEPVSDDKGCDRAILLHKCFAPYKNEFAFA